MGWLDNIEGKLDDALDDVKEEIGERLEQAGASLFGNDNEGLGGGEITLTVDGLPLGPYALTADSFLSQISEYRFYCAVAVGVEAGSFLDKPAQWSCTSADGLSRDYAGKVTRIDQGRILPDGQEEWVLTVSSGLAALRQQSRYRIVHRRTVIELAEELLQEYGLTVDNRTHEYYPAMDWTAQVGETDLQFLQRLLARDGIWFYSSLAEQGEVIVLADDQHGASRADRGELAVTAETGGSRSVAGHAMVALRQSRRYYRWQPDRSRVHQQVCPSEAAALTQESQSSAGKVATQQTFFQSGSSDAHSSLTQARLEQERQQCRSHTILVSGAVGDLQAGQWLPVAGHGPCLITRAALTFSSPRNHQGNSPNGFTWEAELLPLAQPFRPALSAQISLPLVFPARVEAGGPYSHVDGMANRKARIDFDDGDQPLTESSPPLRQLQPHGSLPGKDGQATGWDWPLRNGAEVLLTCLNNDPDKPLILGYAPAASQPGPVSNRNAPENRILTPAGHLLNLNDRKEAQAITLNTPDGQCLLDLNANSESPLVTLACEQGALVMRAGQHQNIDVGKNSQIRIGSDSTTQVLNRSVIHTDSGVIHHQSQTSTHLTATANAALKSGKNLELYSAANSQLRVQGSATITARKGLASKVGGNLQLQATDAIDIRGDGSGDLTLHQGGGGITIKANGTVRLFGNTVTLKGQSGVTFNGDKEYGVPKGVKADKPVPMPASAITPVAEMDLDPEWQGESSSAQLRSVRWQEKTVQLGDETTAIVRVRGLNADETLSLTQVERYGDNERDIESWQQTIEKTAGDIRVLWPVSLPGGVIQVTGDEEDSALLTRDYLLRVRYQGQVLDTEQPLNIMDSLRFTPLSEAGGPLPEGTPGSLEDGNGDIHYSQVTNGLLTFPGVPLGQARLSLDHYEHLSQPEYQAATEQQEGAESCSLRACSRAELCPVDDDEATELTCKLAPIEDLVIIPASEEVLLLTGAEVQRLERLEEKYNAPVIALQEAIQAGDDQAVDNAKKELEALLAQPASNNGGSSEGDNGNPPQYAKGGSASHTMMEVVRPRKLGGSQFSFIPSDALAYHRLEGDRRYTVQGIRDSLDYGTNDMSADEQAEQRKSKLQEAFGNVSAKIKGEVELIDKREGQIQSRQLLKALGPTATLAEILPDSWFDAVDGWVEKVNEKAQFAIGWKESRRDKALALLGQDEIDQSGLGQAQDYLQQVWPEEQDQPQWFDEFITLESLSPQQQGQWHTTINNEPLPPERFSVDGGASFMRYVGGATASFELDAMKGMVSAEAKAELDLSLAQGRVRGQFLLPDDTGWQARFTVRRRSTQVRVAQARSLVQTTSVDQGSFPSPWVISLLNQRLKKLKVDSQLTRTEMRVDAIGRNASGNYCPYRTRAIQGFLLGDVNGWLSLFREGIWGNAEQQKMINTLGPLRITSDQSAGQILSMMGGDLLDGLIGENASSPLPPGDEKELRVLIVQYFQEYRDLSLIGAMSFYSSEVRSNFHQCQPPNSQSYCEQMRRPTGSGDILLNPFRVTEVKNVLQDEEARLGAFRFDVTTSLTGFAGANLMASGKIYINPKQGSLEAIGLRSDAPWPDEKSQRSGMINTEALPAPADNVKVAKSTRSPFDTELDDQQGANVKLEAFVGVKATLGIKGGLMWQQPQASQFKALGSVGYTATGMAGIGAGLDFQVGFDVRTGRFVIHCKAELAFKVGVGGGFSFTVDAMHVKDFLELLYNELRDAEFNVIDLFDDEDGRNRAFDAFCSFQYELFKRGGVVGVAAGAAATGSLLAVSAVQAVFNYGADLLYRWERWDDDSEAAHRLAETLLDEAEARELLGYAFPETKGRLLNTLISAGTTRRDINLLSGGLDERREEAVVVVLESIQYAREYQEVMEHMGVNIPVNDGSAEKMVRALDNELRLLTFLDGEERARFLSISERFAGR